MSARNEEFLHLDTCIDRMGEAWRTLVLIREHPNDPLIGPAFRFALVSYAAPYKTSEGIVKKRHRLDDRYVPPQFAKLHERLLEARDKVHAHTDLSALDPKLSFDDGTGQRLVTRIQNHFTGLEELGNLKDIVRLVELTLDNMCADRERLKAGLEP
jgi:hypothetical protein